MNLHYVRVFRLETNYKHSDYEAGLILTFKQDELAQLFTTVNAYIQEAEITHEDGQPYVLSQAELAEAVACLNRYYYFGPADNHLFPIALRATVNLIVFSPTDMVSLPAAKI
jgi:hypothetical protein